MSEKRLQTGPHKDVNGVFKLLEALQETPVKRAYERENLDALNKVQTNHNYGDWKLYTTRAIET